MIIGELSSANLNFISMITSTTQTRLNSQYESHFRRIWVQYVRLSKRRGEYRICLTIFPHDGEYFFLFSDMVNNVNFDECSSLIENYLADSN